MPVTEIPIPFHSNPNEGQDANAPVLFNAYAQDNGEGAIAPFSLIPVGGIKTFGSETGSGCRGLMYLEDESLLYAVQGARLFKVEENATFTSLAFIAGSDPVYMARNDADTQQLMVVSGGNVYIVENGAASRKQYTQTTVDDDGNETINELAFVGVTYVGGYFLLWLADGRFFVSELQSTVVDELQFATAEGDPDGLIAAHGTNNAVYLIGPNSIEYWGVTGEAFPLRRVQGVPLRFGSRSPHTVRDLDTGIAMVCSDNVVRRLDGYQYVTISSNEVSRLIENETDKTKLVAFTHERGKNKFYVLQGTGWTREYNSTTGRWHNREDTLGNQWHCVHHAKAWNRDILGDRVTGQLYEIDYTLFTDDGNAVPWGWFSPVIHAKPGGLSFYRMFLDLETGDGESLSDEAQIMVSWSDDSGRIFKGERRPSLGKTGEYRTRVKITGLGSCGDKGRIFRVIITDNVIRAVHGAYVDAERVAL